MCCVHLTHGHYIDLMRRMKVQQNHATYCTVCAYAKGLCAICGKQVLDTSMYKMSDGGNSWHKVGQRDEAKYKSEEQIAREGAQQELLEFLQSTGQVGRMPTRGAFDASGKRELVATLIRCYGGLHAAADSMGLSKRLLNEEAEAKKQERQQAAAEEAEAMGAVAPSATGETGASVEGGDDDNDLPPGVELPSIQPPPPPAKTADAVSIAAPAPTKPMAPASTDSRWQYDPNTGLYFQVQCTLSNPCHECHECPYLLPQQLFSAAHMMVTTSDLHAYPSQCIRQLSTQTYYNHDKKKYYLNGKWSEAPPARQW